MRPFLFHGSANAARDFRHDRQPGGIARSETRDEPVKEFSVPIAQLDPTPVEPHEAAAHAVDQLHLAARDSQAHTFRLATIMIAALIGDRERDF